MRTVCLSLRTDLKHLHSERACHCSAQFPFRESAHPTTHAVAVRPSCGFLPSDTGKQRGQKLNPAASCIQWLNWWSIGTGQDAAAWLLIPRSEAIRTAAITPWSLLPSRCSWWYCSLGNDYPAIKTNVGFIGAEILGRYCVAIRHTICSTRPKSKHLWQEVIRLNEPDRTWRRPVNLDCLCMSEWVKGHVFKLTVAVFGQMWTQCFTNKIILCEICI